MIRNCTFRSESLGISYFGVQIRDSGHVQVAIYTVFHEESESAVKKCRILQPGGENKEKRNRESRFLIVGFLIVCLHRSGLGLIPCKSILFSTGFAPNSPVCLPVARMLFKVLRWVWGDVFGQHQTKRRKNNTNQS